MPDEALARAKGCEQAGANGFFAPGLAYEALIGRLCEEAPLPVYNIALPDLPDTKRWPVSVLPASAAARSPIAA